MSNTPIAIIASVHKTYYVYGDLSNKTPIEGGIYYDHQDNRLYYYSTIFNRSCPATGYFPIWNGESTTLSKFSNHKYLGIDTVNIDIDAMAGNITSDVAKEVIHKQRKASYEPLLPTITNGDNMFTQCIKGVIIAKKYSLLDLFEMAGSGLNDNKIEAYYQSLCRVPFMRVEKWYIWIAKILHVNYIIDVYNDEITISFNFKKDLFTIDGDDIGKYDDITKSKCDPLKKFMRIIMRMKHINKNDLKSDNVDMYTINNMMTTINGNKVASAQIFSRFIRMTELSYSTRIYDNNGNIIFEYSE